MADRRYHVEFRDGVSGESLGLMLGGKDGAVGFRRHLVNPYAAKGAQGATAYSDLTEWSMQVFDDWRGGRGHEELDDPSGYYEGHGVETRVEGQLTLGPLATPSTATAADVEYMPGDVTEYAVGYPADIVNHDEDGELLVEADQKVGQRFLVPTMGQWWVTSIKFKLRKSGSGHSSDVKGAIYSDVSGNPDTELVSVAVGHATIGSSYAEETFTFSSPYSLTPGSYYWAVFDANNSGGDYDARRSPVGGYVNGYIRHYKAASWDAVSGDCYFEVALGCTVALEQSFTTPAGGMTCAEVRLYLRRVGIPGEITVGLYADSGGSPTGSALKSETVADESVDTVAGWVSATWAGEALAGSTVFHIVVTAAAGVGPGSWLMWGGDSGAGYASGAAKYKTNGSWAAAGADLYFRAFDSGVGTGVVLDGNPVAFARWEGKWYCGAGDTVYYWNSTNSNWDVSEASAGNNITSMEVWDGYLWVARGTSTNVRKYDGSWADGGVEADLLFRGGPAGGWLHRSDPDTVNQFYYTDDGSTWSSAFVCGATDHAITGFAWFQDMLVVATTVGLYGFVVEMVYQLLDWRGMEHADNGKGMMGWGRDGALYIPLLYGLYRWNGDTMRAVGPEQGAPSELEPPGPWAPTPLPPRWWGPPGPPRPKGLPKARAGAVLALWGTNNWLYAAIEGGAGRTSSVMATDGMRGWHEITRAETTDQVIQAVAYETIYSPHRLWYGLGTETRFVELPDFSDNPYGWTGLTFVDSGELITSWVGSDLAEVVKDLHEVVLKGEGISSSQAVEVWYEVDRSGLWMQLGQMEESPRDVLAFEVSGPTKKTLTSGSTRTTIELASGSTTGDMVVGQWVRINREVAQVASVTDTDTFTLETALSEAPVSGDYVYASRPAGREVRLKLILKTDDTTTTPLVKAVLLQYQPNVQDRYGWSLGVLVEDGMADLAGGVYPLSAAALRMELNGWVKRPTPFTLVDPDGEEWTVKVSAAGERRMQMDRKGEHGEWGYKSVWDVTVVEVG